MIHVIFLSMDIRRERNKLKVQNVDGGKGPKKIKGKDKIKC